MGILRGLWAERTPRPAPLAAVLGPEHASWQMDSSLNLEEEW